MIRHLAAFALVSSISVASAAPLRPARSQSFDWDANVAHMTTKLYLKKPGGGELVMQVGKWDHIKKLATDPTSEYYGLTIDPHGPMSTYRDMGDLPGRNPFVEDLQKTIQQKGWKGPSWDAFVEQLSTPQGARRASIITAREHSPEAMYAGLKLLKQKGYIKYLPSKDKLFAVNRPGFAVDGETLSGSTPERKLAVQMSVLDKLQGDAQKGMGRRQEWHFSDDDWANYAATKSGLQPLIDQGRWPNVDIVVHYTGTDHAAEVVKLARPRI